MKIAVIYGGDRYQKFDIVGIDVCNKRNMNPFAT